MNTTEDEAPRWNERGVAAAMLGLPSSLCWLCRTTMVGWRAGETTGAGCPPTAGSAGPPRRWRRWARRSSAPAGATAMTAVRDYGLPRVDVPDRLAVFEARGLDETAFRLPRLPSRRAYDRDRRCDPPLVAPRACLTSLPTESASAPVNVTHGDQL